MACRLHRPARAGSRRDHRRRGVAQPHVVSTTAAIALGLVLGGAAGNLSDRVFRAPGPLRGAVVDFVAIGWGPIFNAADVCVVIGVTILTWRLLADGRDTASA
jgi:lipoprotein signal peptidase